MLMKKTLPLLLPICLVAGPVLAQTARSVETEEMASPFGRKGFYVGFAMGGAFNPGATDWDGSGFNGNNLQKLTGNANNSAFTTGLYFGYRFPLNASWVLGPEADINYVGDFRKHDSLVYNFAGGPLAPAGTYTFTSNRSANFFGTLRSHIGYTFNPQDYGVPLNPVELYLSGGFAYGGNSGRGGGTVTYTAPGGAQKTAFVSSGSDAHTGGVFGLGAQYAFAPNLDGRIEYMYVKLKTDNHTFTPPGGGSYFVSDDVKGTFNVVRVGLAYHF